MTLRCSAAQGHENKDGRPWQVQRKIRPNQMLWISCLWHSRCQAVEEVDEEPDLPAKPERMDVLRLSM